MTLLKKLACAAAVAMSMGSAQAALTVNEWVFNPNGGGFDKGQQVLDYLDVSGMSFFALTRTGGSGYTFTHHAVFNIVQADSNGRLFPINYPGGNITAMFEAQGTGRFGDTLSFSGGTIRMYQNPTGWQYGGTEGIYGANLGNLIASFDVLGGGGNVDASGSPTASGEFTVRARADAGSIMSGYFFRNDGTDLWDKLLLNFTFANANIVGLPNTHLVDEVACQYAGFTGPGCNGTEFANMPGEHFFVGNNGQFRAVEVPEPGSLALFGIALLGAGIAGRKRAARA